MSLVKLNPMFHKNTRSLGDIVFYERNGVLFNRVKGERKKAASAVELEIRKTFRHMTSSWSGSTDAIRKAWNAYALAKGAGLSGYNRFIKENYTPAKAGTPLQLCRQMGDIKAPTLTVATATVSGSITGNYVNPAGNPDGKFIQVLAINKKAGETQEKAHVVTEAVTAAAGDFEITGLIPGDTYFIYAVFTDVNGAAVTKVSESAALTAIAAV